MGNHKLGDRVSAWLIGDLLTDRPSVWKSGTVEEIVYGGYYKIRLDNGETVHVYQRYIRSELNQELMPGRIVGVTLLERYKTVEPGTHFGIINWVTNDFAQIAIQRDDQETLVVVSIDRVLRMTDVN